MPRKVSMTEQDKEWLRQNHAHFSYSTLAKRFGCHTDTLKRILVREGLQDFTGAKYALPANSHTLMWNRPCMACGDDKPRPKGLYFCDSCRDKLE